MLDPDPTPNPALALDAKHVLKLAAQSLFDTFGRTAMGTMRSALSGRLARRPKLG